MKSSMPGAVWNILYPLALRNPVKTQIAGYYVVNPVNGGVISRMESLCDIRIAGKTEQSGPDTAHP